MLILTGKLFEIGSAQVGIAPTFNDAAARQRLIDEVLIPGGITDRRVLDAIGKTQRHHFVPAEVRDQAYLDRALPIGESQTISSPYIVAVMTQELDPQPEHKVLEIGTGSGYQAAVLSPLVKAVYTIEIVEKLAVQAQRVLANLGYTNVFTKTGDGFLGWEEHAPFDRIIVTCSPEDVPQPLADQLAEGGLMIIPVGERYQQMLCMMRKRDGKLQREALRPTLFVPMTGQAESQRRIHADPARPSLVNGDFEQPVLESGDIPGWYYQRGLTLQNDPPQPIKPNSAQGAYVQFNNDVRGRPTHLLQGLALDGRRVRRITLSASVRVKEVRAGLERDELPAVTVRFYDDQRNLLGTQFLGPFKGTKNWHQESRFCSVPDQTREAIVSIGLFGATGTAAFDNVVLEPARTER
ncbi:MAG: protein-L-isoaspartate(D-aspartate) O-methyltransferase [Pirellulaceae bacterium]|nr:protein-L-isoaspartate(D-aspartate) O-methyltransferase [Pirellulaceae bacterium]